MKEMFLLGAGASVEAGIPAVYDMTKKMLDFFGDDNRLNRQFRILKFVVGGLLFQQGAKNINPYKGINIEDLFNAVLILGNRNDSEISPFVGSWHPMLQDLQLGELTVNTTRSMLRNIFDPIEQSIDSSIRRGRLHKIEDSSFRSRFQKDFEEAVRQSMGNKSKWLFSQTADAMVDKLIDMVWITNQSNINYLTPLLDYAEKNKCAIATLNYDNSVELAAQANNNRIDTGFESWSLNGEFVFRRNWIPLIKLHGSIDWSLTYENISTNKILPFQIIKKVDPSNKNDRNYHPAVVFGGKNKLTASGPSLSLIRSFEKELGKCGILNVIGYSFHDEHVNEFIRNWLNGSIDRIIKIVDPNFDSIDSDFIDPLRDAQKVGRMQLMTEFAGQAIKQYYCIHSN